MFSALIKNVTALRKDGKLKEAWDIIAPELKKHRTDMGLKRTFFWVCYDFLKQIKNRLKARSSDRKSVSPPYESELKDIQFYDDCISWLNLPGDGIEYITLLRFLHEIVEFMPKVIVLLFRHRNTIFESKDSIPYKNDKGESPSVMLKFARIFARAWRKYKVVRKISVTELRDLVNSTRDKVEDRKNLFNLDLDLARCLIFDNQPIEAREHVRQVLQRKQSVYWIWELLADTYEQELSAEAIALYSKALALANGDEFQLGILKKLAPILAVSGYENEGSMCVKRAVDCYSRKGWPLKNDLRKLTKENWYDSSVDAELLTSFIESQSAGALSYLVGATDTGVAVVQYLHTRGKGFKVFVTKERSIDVRLGLYKQKKLPNVGDYVRLTIARTDGEVVAVEATQPEEIDDVEVQEGYLKIINNSYGFVNQTYVPQSLIQSRYEGRVIRVLSIYNFDKKKEEYRWKAIKIISDGNSAV